MHIFSNIYSMNVSAIIMPVHFKVRYIMLDMCMKGMVSENWLRKVWLNKISHFLSKNEN